MASSQSRFIMNDDWLIHDINYNDLYILCIELDLPGKAKAEHSVVQRWSGVIWPPLFACKQIPRHKTKFSIHHNSIIRQTLSRKHIFQIRQFWRGKHRIKSKMEIDPATQGDAGIYECHANNK